MRCPVSKRLNNVKSRHVASATSRKTRPRCSREERSHSANDEGAAGVVDISCQQNVSEVESPQEKILIDAQWLDKFLPHQLRRSLRREELLMARLSPPTGKS